MNSFLQWYHLIFLAPLAVAAILLIFTLAQGMDGEGDSDADSDMDTDADGDGDIDSDAESHTQHAGAIDPVFSSKPRRKPAKFSILRLIGVGRAPLMFVLETLCVFWGILGYFANLILLKSTSPTLVEVMPSVAIALVGGIVGARASSELFAKLLPETETRVISRDALIGMKGRVTFEVTANSGRIRIYDDHGTIHEHECRPSPAQPFITKGREALVMDREGATNRLIVEELSG